MLVRSEEGAYMDPRQDDVGVVTVAHCGEGGIDTHSKRAGATRGVVDAMGTGNPAANI